MTHKLTIADLLGVSDQLTHKECCYCIEYCKDFDVGRAAQASGFSAADGMELLSQSRISSVINRILSERMYSSEVDAAWVREQLVNNHYLALQKDNINASNTALVNIAKLAEVDAFAATKIEMSSDEQVRERLQRARQRASNNKAPDFLH